MMKEMIMTNLNILVIKLEGIILKRSLGKLTTKAPLLRSMEFISYNMRLIVKWLNILYISSGRSITLSLQEVHYVQRRIISADKDSSRS